MQDEDEDIGMISYCGLYCDSCFMHAGKIADLARGLRKELREARFDKIHQKLACN